jgi:hypothetical protein
LSSGGRQTCHNIYHVRDISKCSKKDREGRSDWGWVGRSFSAGRIIRKCLFESTFDKRVAGTNLFEFLEEDFKQKEAASARALRQDRS